TDGFANKRRVDIENFITYSLPVSMERIGHSGFSCATRSSLRKTQRSWSKNRVATFPTSIFAGSARWKKSAAKRNARQNRHARLAIRFLAKRKCAVARHLQSVSIFSSAQTSRNKPKRSRGNAFVICRSKN